MKDRSTSLEAVLAGPAETAPLARKPLTITVLEFGELVGIKRTKTFQLIRDNELEAVRIGRCTRITMQSVEALIERSKAR